MSSCDFRYGSEISPWIDLQFLLQTCWNVAFTHHVGAPGRAMPAGKTWSRASSCCSRGYALCKVWQVRRWSGTKQVRQPAAFLELCRLQPPRRDCQLHPARSPRAKREKYIFWSLLLLPKKEQKHVLQSPLLVRVWIPRCNANSLFPLLKLEYF